MKKLIALFALALPLAGQAEVTPLRCNIERVVGAKTDEDLKPVNYKAEGEYRIVPADDVLAMFDGEDAEGLKRMLERHMLFYGINKSEEGAFFRPVSQNPKEWWAWTPCGVTHQKPVDEKKNYSKEFGDFLARPAYSYYSCANGDFKFNTLTNRFHRVEMGDWYTRDKNTKSIYFEKLPASDYYFEFGTCEPYYD